MHGIASKLKRRLADRGGFTLMEMVASLFIVALLTGMVAMGVSIGVKSFVAARGQSQVEILSGEIENVLSTPFRFMQVEQSFSEGTIRSIQVSDHGQTVTIVNPQLESSKKTDADPYRLYLTGMVDGQMRSIAAGTAIPLLDESAYGMCNVQVLDPGTYRDDSVTFTYRIWFGERATGAFAGDTVTTTGADGIERRYVDKADYTRDYTVQFKVLDDVGLNSAV